MIYINQTVDEIIIYVLMYLTKTLFKSPPELQGFSKVTRLNNQKTQFKIHNNSKDCNLGGKTVFLDCILKHYHYKSIFSLL